MISVVMNNARRRTLSRMKTLIAISASTLAATNCSDCTGFQTVDPLPTPGSGSCGSFSNLFTVSARFAKPTTTVRDASTTDTGAEPKDASSDAADAADAGDGGVGDGEDDGGVAPDAGADAGTIETLHLLLTIEARPGSFSPSSLKGARATLRGAKASGSVTLIESLPSESILDINLDLQKDLASSFDLDIDNVMCASFTGGVMSAESATLHVTLGSNNAVQSIRATLGGGPPEEVY